ncbi:MAG: polysaccharide biosynthesis C-terminal domain-containing protein [Saprospiraceae bacterium]|nr:polysaccharide biosynthesis C-terminal domain-containing protein [Saprospiraceae bacterium]
MTHFRHAARNVLTKLTVAIIAFGVSIFIPRLLGAGHYGYYAFLTVSIGFLIPLTSMGLGAGFIYLLASRRYKMEQAVQSQILLASAIGAANAIFLLVAWLFEFPKALFLQMTVSEWIVLAICSFSQTISYFAGRMWTGLSEFRKLNAIDLFGSLSAPISLFICYYLTGSEERNYILYALLIHSIAMLAANAWFVKGMQWMPTWNAGFVREAFQYGAKSWFGDMALRANLRLDQLILGSVSPISSLGVYSAAVKLSELIWYIPDAVGPVLYNKIASTPSGGQQLQLLGRVHRLLFSGCTVVSILWAAAVVWVLIPFVLGPEFQPAVWPFLWLMPGTVLLISTKVLTKLYSAGGNVQWTSQITIAGSMMSALLYLILIPWKGIMGAAIASSVGYFAMGMVCWLYAMKHYHLNPVQYFVLRWSDIRWLGDQIKNALCIA